MIWRFLSDLPLPDFATVGLGVEEFTVARAIASLFALLVGSKLRRLSINLSISLCSRSMSREGSPVWPPAILRNSIGTESRSS